MQLSLIPSSHVQDLELPMGLPFDWHLRPRRFGSFAASHYAGAKER